MPNIAKYFNSALLSKAVRNVHRATDWDEHAYIPDQTGRDLSTDLNISLFTANLFMGAITYP